MKSKLFSSESEVFPSPKETPSVMNIKTPIIDLKNPVVVKYMLHLVMKMMLIFHLTWCLFWSELLGFA